MSNLLRTVTLDRAVRKKDKSVSFTFITSTEQTSEQFMEIDALLNDSGVLFFKSNGNLTKEEVKALESTEIEVEGKSKAQRLRNVLYVYQKQLQESGLEPMAVFNMPFHEFYAQKMEEIIEHFKGKLEKD